MTWTNASSFVFRWPEPPEPLQQPAATKEEAEIADGLHQPPDLRVGEAFPVPKIPQSRGQGRDRVQFGPDQRPGHHVVPEQAGETEEGHGGAEEGRGERQDPQRSQEFLGERY